jgi:hypothetical protein
MPKLCAQLGLADKGTKIVHLKDAKIVQTAALFGAKHIRARVGGIP